MWLNVKNPICRTISSTTHLNGSRNWQRASPTNSLIAKTTLDPSLQKAAEESVAFHLRQYGEDYRANQAAMAVIEYGGQLRAVVGGRDYGESQYNRATRAQRQPGSTFKPYVYTYAVQRGYKPKQIVSGAGITIRGWTPQNYNGRRFGRVSLTTALVKSINTVPVRLASKLGRQPIVDLAQRMGVESPLTAEPAMPLGTNEMTVLEQTTGYGVFMSGGMSTNRHAILQITDTSGKVLYDFKKDGTKPVKVISEEATAAMNEMLSQVPEWGTGRRSKLDGIKTAGKTGTTQSYRDAWFVGYTGNYTAAVWFGNDNYGPTKRLTGGRLPAMTWKKFMTFAHQNIELRPLPFVEPEPVKDLVAGKSDGSNSASDPNSGLLRQKPLPPATADLLRKLITDLQEAQPLRPLTVSDAAKVSPSTTGVQTE